MGLLEPWISFTTQAEPAQTSGFWAFLGNLLGIGLVQAVTIWLFYKKLSVDLGSEDAKRDATWERFRQTKQMEAERDSKNLKMNMKRDVYMDMAPAIQQNISQLAEFLRINESMEKIQKGMRIRQRQNQQAIAKLVPVASDDTLDAMRAFQASILASQVRLLKERNAFDATRTKEKPDGTDGAAQKLFEAWVKETEDLPPLMADLASSVRKELEMPFDRRRFEEGMKNTNKKSIQVLREQIFPNSQREK